MKPAKNIKELYNNLNPFFIPIKGKDDNVYVPIFDNCLKSLRTQILIGEYKKECYYITGQSGSGKSSALNFLSNDRLEGKFELIYLKGREILDLSDIDIIDLLLMLALEVNERLSDHGNLTGKLNKIVDIRKRRMEEETIRQSTKNTETEGSFNISAGARFLQFFKIGAEFKKNYRREKEYRTVTRSFFTFDKNELLKLVNELIHKFYEEQEGKKSILVIFDDLEKIRELDQMNSIFIENSFYFKDIECKKVLTFPVCLTTNPSFTEINRYFFSLKIYQNPLSKEKQRNTDSIEKNTVFFKEMIRKRISFKTQLIEPQAIDKAIEMSGGNLSQFFNILYRAALLVLTSEGKKISIHDVEQACHNEKRNLEQAIIGDTLIKILSTIQKTHLPNIGDQKAEFVNAILTLQIIVFYNDSVWYEVNPLINSTVSLYAERIEP
ncbi:MAG: hypothetical protein FJY10_02425 [Bacteroidetes bacterium]|nr:hypothetical protein [Bacteroidota bacterium]